MKTLTRLFAALLLTAGLCAVPAGAANQVERLTTDVALAEAHGVESLAFCCISTGVFRFPHERAAEIAVAAVRRYKQETNSGMKVIFNVFKDTDYAIYQRLLRADRPPAAGALGR